MSPSVRYQPVHDPASWVALDEHSGAAVAGRQMDRESPYVNNSVYVVITRAVDDGECLPETRGKCFLAPEGADESQSTNGRHTSLPVTVQAHGDCA